MPFFSVVIPTRNRAHLLQYALQSVLEQTFDDYEVIVSDNASSNDTRQLVADLGGDRVRYVNTGRHLYVSDSWDFAVRHAVGDYVFLLCDDDCLCPSALETAWVVLKHKPAEIVAFSFPYATYGHDDHPDVNERNTLRLPAFTDQVVSVEASQVLQKVFSLDFYRIWLGASNNAISRDIIQHIISRIGRFYMAPYPDVSGTTMALSCAHRVSYVDYPLVLLGRALVSLWPSCFSRSSPLIVTDWHSLSEEITNEPFMHVPLRGIYDANGQMESLLRAKESLPESFEGIPIAWDRYFLHCYYDMQRAKALGRDIRQDAEQFRGVLSNLPSDLRKKIERGSLSVLILALFWRFIDSSTFLRRSEPIIRSRLPVFLRRLEPIIRNRFPVASLWLPSKWPVVIHGEEACFSNILECARRLEAICSTIEPDEEAYAALARKIT